MNLRIKDGDATFALARFRFFLQVFAQHTGNGIAMVTGKLGDLDIGPALLLQIVKVDRSM